jgi:predicted lipoprotein with Yx(FWY)xxD motif
MKRTILLGVLLVMALLISACAPAAVTQSPGQSATQAPATSSPEATEPPSATASPAVAATNTGSATDATASPVVATTSTRAAAGTTATSDASVPVTGQAEVRAASNFDYGPILVNGDGVPLYIYDKDTQNGTTSACTDEACTANWTPLTSEGTATAGPGVIQSLLGTITREDGTTQVTYNGWPLYTYNSDTSADSPAGQGAEPGWTLVSSSGKAIPAQ